MIEKDVQKRILRAISLNSGTAKTSKIMEISKLSRSSVHNGARHLVSRALISKKTVGKPPNKVCVFKLNDNLREKIIRLIGEIEQ